MRNASLANSFAKGVLDPNLSERIDLAHYYQACSEAENTVATPQGGVKDRGGTTLVTDADLIGSGIERRLRKRLEPIRLTASMVTALTGGNAADAVDQNPATAMVTSAIATTPFGVIEVDLGAPRRVDAVDVIGLSVSVTGINESLAVEWWNTATSQWVTFGGTADNPVLKHIRPQARTRRFAGWPGYAVTAQKFRVVLYGAAGAGTVSLTGIALWAEMPVLSPIRHFTMARSQTEAYELVVTDRNIDVFRDMRWQAAIPVDIAGEQIEVLGIETSLDTLLIFHDQVETIKIVRQGSDGEWDAGAPEWTNVPDLASTTAFSGSQDEIQIIDLTGVTVGAGVKLMLGGLVSAAVTYTDDATFASSAAAAIGALNGVTAGDVTVTVAAQKRFRVQFVNANGSRSWPLLVPVIAGGAIALPATTIVQRGLDATTGAKLWSARTGWPGCGAFIQSRLMIAGFRAAPTSYAISRVAKLYDFQTTSNPMTADLGLVRALDVDEIESIYHIFVGRHVQIFTEAGEWYLESRTIDATQVQNAVLATRNGVDRKVTPVFADGATVYVQSGGRTLADFKWDINVEGYRADPLSVLAPHLLTGVVDMAHRPARSVQEGNQLVMINADGTAALLTLLRSQDVIALMPWSTPHGALRRVAVDVNHNILLIVERSGAHYLEKVTPSLPLDCATTLTGSAITVVPDLPFPDGREVWAIADDDLVGPLTVAGGSVTLPQAAAKVTVGLAPPWRARLPVVRGKPSEERPFRPPARIYEVELSLVDTGDITIATNGKAAVRVPLTRSGDQFARGGPLQTATGGAPGLPLMQRLYTGDRRLQGFTGWTSHAFIELSREVPAPVHVKSVRYEVAHG